MPVRFLSGYSRYDVLKLLPHRPGMLGVELGVAAGEFSRRMVRSGIFAHCFGVDVYADHHDTDEYKKALRAIGLESPYKLLRMSFDDALDLFPDGGVDFVYVDGYAHTGEDGGGTIYRWHDKVSVIAFGVEED